MAMDKYASLVLEFDKVTGAMRFAGQESVSLQKQVRLLRQELTLGKYTQDEFAKIQNALAETEFKLKQAQLRGKDLFEQIGTLGGGFGEMSNRIDRALKLFNALNNVTFDEIKAKFANLAALISGDVESISEEINVIQEAGGRTRRESTGNVGEAGDAMRGISGVSTVAAGAGAAASADAAVKAINMITAKQAEVIVKNVEILSSWGRVQAGLKSGLKIKDILGDTEPVDEAAKAFEDWAIENESLLLKVTQLREKYKDWIFTVSEGTLVVGINDKALRALTNAELELLATTDALAVSTNGYIVTQEVATAEEKKNAAAKAANAAITAVFNKVLNAGKFAFDTYNKSVNVGTKALQAFGLSAKAAEVAASALMSLGIVALISIVTQAAQVLFEFVKEGVTGFAKMEAEAKNMNEQIKLTQKFLDFDLKTLQKSNAEKLADMKRYNSSAKDIREQERKGAEDVLIRTEQALEESQIKQLEAQGNFDAAIKLNQQRNRERVKFFAGDALALAAEEKRFKETGDRIQKSSDLFNLQKSGFFGVSTEFAKQTTQNIEDSGNEVLALEARVSQARSDLYVKSQDNITQNTRDYYQNYIKELDAQIEKEIYSEDTRTSVLEELYRKRNAAIDYLEFNGYNKSQQNAERNRIQQLKILNAQIDDQVRATEKIISNLEEQLVYIGKNTTDEFELRRNIANQEFSKEMDEARRDERTREENERKAYSKLYKAIREIDIKELESRKELTQNYYRAALQNSNEFFILEKQLIQDELAVQLEIYRGNEEKKLALKKEYAKKTTDVEAKQLQYQSDQMGRRADLVKTGGDWEEKYTFKSLFNRNNILRQKNEEEMKFRQGQEKARYNAEVKANGDSLDAQKQHFANMNQIQADYYENNQTVNQLLAKTAIEFGQLLGEIGNALLENAQGRNKQYFENAKKVAKAAVIIEKAGAISQIISNTGVANAQAKVYAPPLGEPFATFNRISAAISIGGIILSASKAINEIDGKTFNESKSMGKNYAGGGMIGGNRHYQGGTMIEAEQGEAVMTRGAVTMFAPLLSTLNQMGGGTAFSRGAVGQAGFDNPQLTNVSNPSTQIIKTYVVENELTTIQQKQARLKSLSTL